MNLQLSIDERIADLHPASAGRIARRLRMNRPAPTCFEDAPDLYLALVEALEVKAGLRAPSGPDVHVEQAALFEESMASVVVEAHASPYGRVRRVLCESPHYSKGQR
jgi:hypothetical protein